MWEVIFGRILMINTKRWKKTLLRFERNLLFDKQCESGTSVLKSRSVNLRCFFLYRMILKMRE